MAVARTAWRDEAARIDPARLVFLDESGFDARLVRTHARAPRGKRAHGAAPGGHWRRLTLIGALGLDGLCATMPVAAATGTAVFLAFVEQVLIPALLRERPDAVVVMDNLAAHKAARVQPWTRPGSATATARMLAGHEPDRTRLVQAEGSAAQRRRKVARSPRIGHPRSPRCRHVPQRPRLVPPRSLRFKLTRNPL